MDLKFNAQNEFGSMKSPAYENANKKLGKGLLGAVLPFSCRMFASRAFPRWRRRPRWPAPPPLAPPLLVPTFM